MPCSRVYRVIGSIPRSGVILCEVGPLHDQASWCPIGPVHRGNDYSDLDLWDGSLELRGLDGAFDRRVCTSIPVEMI